MEYQPSKQRSRIRWGIIGFLVLIILSVSFDFPSYVDRVTGTIGRISGITIPSMYALPFKLGLDLKGGAHLVYEADVSKIPSAERSESVEGVRDVIERRVNALGVSESIVQTSTSGDFFRIIVDLPGVSDVAEAMRIIGETPTLDFRVSTESPSAKLTQAQIEEINIQNKEVKDVQAQVSQRIRQSGFAAALGEYANQKNNDIAVREQSAVNRLNVAPEIYDWIKQSGSGRETAVPIETDEAYTFLRLTTVEQDDPEVEASHILVCFEGADHCTVARSESVADKLVYEIKSKATPQNFADLAKEYSDDGSAQNGGSLGAFGKGIMVKEFEDAVFSGPTGEIIGPIKTQFGFHLILKTKEIKHKKAIADTITVHKLSRNDFLPSDGSWVSVGLTGSLLKRASVQFDQYSGEPQVGVEFNSEGADLFRQLTKENIGNPIAIFLDGQPISIPVVQSEILNGSAVISGSFTPNEAKLLAQRLNAGALPVPVTLVAQEAIGATLGSESLVKSLTAGILSLLLVLLFMIIIYRVPGVLAAVALILYAGVSLAIFKLIPVTLTLAGIAGFILSIGMAVDANILIFERLKEELRLGKGLSIACEEGFKRAWTSIRDGNLSTLISCVVLYWFGTGVVRGFAVTLAIGVLVSMFTAITVTKVFMRFFELYFREKHTWLFLARRQK